MGDRNRGRTPTKHHRRPATLGFRPRLEALDERAVPATFTWTGLGGSSNWSNPGNWQGNKAPNPATSAQDTLSFPAYSFTAAGTQTTNIAAFNDFPTGTKFGSIQISTLGTFTARSSVQLSGNGIELTLGGITVDSSFGFFGVNGGLATISMPVTFSTNDQTIDLIDPYSKLSFTPAATVTLQNTNLSILTSPSNGFLPNQQVTFSAPITGTGNMTLGDPGTSVSGLVIFAPNLPNTYNGLTTVQGGATLQLSSGSANGGIPDGGLNILSLSSASPSTVTVVGSEQISDNALVTVNSNGLLDFGATSEKLGSLTVNGGLVTGTGNITFNTVDALGSHNVTASGIAEIDPTLDAQNANLKITTQAGGTLQLGSINGLTGTVVTFAGDGTTTVTGPASGSAGYLTVVQQGTLQLQNNATSNQSTNAILPGDVTVGLGAGPATNATLNLLTANSLSASAVVTIGGDGKLQATGKTTGTAGTFTQIIQAVQSTSPNAQIVLGNQGQARGSLQLQPLSSYTYNGSVSGYGNIYIFTPGGFNPLSNQIFTGDITLVDPTGGQAIQVGYQGPNTGNTGGNNSNGAGQADFRGAVSQLKTIGTVYASDSGTGIGTLIIPGGGTNNTAASNNNFIPGLLDPATGVITPATVAVNNLSLDSGKNGFLTIYLSNDTNGQIDLSGQLVTATGSSNGAPFTAQLNVVPTTDSVGADFLSVPGQTYTIVNIQRPSVTVPAGQTLLDQFGNALAEGATYTITSGTDVIPFVVSYSGGDGNDVILTNARQPVATISVAPGQVNPVTGVNGSAQFVVTFNGPVVSFNDAMVQVTTTGDVAYTQLISQRLSDRSFLVTLTGLTGNGTVLINTDTGVAFTAAGRPTLQSNNSTAIVTINGGGGGGGGGGFTPPVPTNPASRVIVGSDSGGGGLVNVYQGTPVPASQLTLDQNRFAGGVRVAGGDFNRDGVRDFVFGTGPGVAPFVRVVDGLSGDTLFEITPFEETFTGGVYVAAGDVTGDGTPDLIITPDQGGGPRVQVYEGTAFNKIADFLGIDDSKFRGGARAAVGDINHDGVGDLIVAAGYGGGPRIAIYNGTSIVAGVKPVKLTADFFAFESTLRNGVYIASVDVNGDGYYEVVAGGGPGGGPRVTAFSGRALLVGQTVPFANFFAGDSEDRNGIRLAAADYDGDGQPELITGSGPTDGSEVRVYKPSDLRLPEPPTVSTFDAFTDFDGGVFVG